MLALLAVALLAPPPPLVVLRPDGVHVVNPRGKVIRTLSRTPAKWAHRLPDGRLVVDDGATLSVIPQKGKPRPLAALPAVDGCGFGAVGPGVERGVELQAAHDVAHTADGRWLCVTLMDRNANMAEFSADYAVDLKTGEVTAHLSMAPGCPETKAPASPCHGALSRPTAGAAPKASSWPYAWKPERAALLNASGAGPDFCVGRPPDGCDTPSSVAVSPSGRWRLVRLPTHQGDYMHHGLFALDHKTGAVHPITEGPWPPPLTPTQLQRLLRNYEAVKTLDVVGEAHVAATGHGERFAVDDLLINPGERVLRVGRLVP